MFLDLSDDLSGAHGVAEEHDFGAVDWERGFECVEEVGQVESEAEESLTWCDDEPAAAGGFADGATSAVGFKEHIFAATGTMKEEQYGEWRCGVVCLLWCAETDRDGFVSACKGDPGIGCAGVLQDCVSRGVWVCELFAESDSVEDGVIGFLEAVFLECGGCGEGGFECGVDEVGSK